MSLSDESREIHLHKVRLARFIESLQGSTPPSFQGRGVIICGGGLKYSPCAWVCIKMLRFHGCQLPIQLWHLGANEMPIELRILFERLNVTIVDACTVKTNVSVHRFTGWELKPFAILNSSFEEVLFIDADNICVQNPEYLFDDWHYQETGAIFWPDYHRLSKGRKIWEICGVDFKDEPEFETGQMVIHKGKCWQALEITMHMNEHSDFYYRYIHGDKDTFHMAWRMTGRAYSMPDYPIYRLPSTMCQHDFKGARIFQHRNMAKWSLYIDYPPICNFLHEKLCYAFLEELRSAWRPVLRVPRYSESDKNERENQVASQLVKSAWIYDRVGFDRRRMSFTLDGRISEGAADNEIFWNVSGFNEVLTLCLSSVSSVTCYLTLCDDGSWRGRWENYERMPIELTRDMDM